jgi:hypothetical protein
MVIAPLAALTDFRAPVAVASLPPPPPPGGGGGVFQRV